MKPMREEMLLIGAINRLLPDNQARAFMRSDFEKWKRDNPELLKKAALMVAEENN